MKKFIISIFSVMILCVSAIPAFAKEQEVSYGYEIEVTPQSRDTGREVAVIIRLTDYTESKPGIRGFQIDIENNEDLLQNASCKSLVTDEENIISNKAAYQSARDLVRHLYAKLSGTMDYSQKELLEVRIPIPDTVADEETITLPFTMIINNEEKQSFEYTSEIEIKYSETEEEKDLSECLITLEKDIYVYDGTEKEPGVTVKDGEKILEEGVHYSVTYEENKEAGIATVVVNAVEGHGYTGKAIRAFVIEKIPFQDISESNWFYDKVKYVYENGLMSGLTVNTFGPDETLTRAQFATILCRADGSAEVAYSDKFPDVPDGQWYTNGVLWASSVGVVSGYSDGKFGTDDSITREQLAVMMYRYAKYKGYDVGETADISSYDDAAKVSSWAADAIAWAVGNHIISGKTSTTLDPAGNATRAECATIIQRFMEKYQ